MKSKILDLIDGLKKRDDYLESLYEDSCYKYDEFRLNAFTDEQLILQQVRLLFMLYSD